MEKNKEITEKAVAAITERLQANVEKFTEVEEQRKLNIDNIEAMWGAAKKEVSAVMDELYNELTNAVAEKELIADKKKASQKR